VSRAVAGVVLVATLLGSPGVLAGGAPFFQTDVAVKAALVFSFAKFTDWPVLAPGVPLAACVVGDDGIAAALTETVRGQSINGHLMEVRRPQNNAGWSDCHLLFIADLQVPQDAAALAAIRALPVLTVSDRKDFAQSSGMIELYVEEKRMRFAINILAAERSGLRLSSRLLSLARVIRGGDGR